MQTLRANHWTKVKNLYGSVRGRTEESERNGNPRGTIPVSIIPDPSGLPETKIKTKKHAWSGS